MDLKIEDVLLRIRDQLNKDQVKLWLPPYTVNEESSENDQEDKAFQELIEKYSRLLNIDEATCGVALRELKDHALMRLKEREVFRQTGLATIKVRVSGSIPQILTIQVILDETASQLIDKVAEKVEIVKNRIKLISSGKVLENSKDLGSQGVKNGTQVMAVILSENLSELQEVEKRLKTLEKTKKDLQFLAGRSSSNDSDYYFDLEDQSGKRLTLPPEERKSLIMAITLHEKGRAALKRDNYALALVLLLEADKEFSACNSALLPKVDNYALLHLDIAWCYLCLRNVTQIPDAEAKLKQCESNFHTSYGPNLERLMALKGTTGNEAALFMRLHLLQGVVLYHQNKREEAKRLFERASNELKALKIDDASLSTLIELGLSPAEARLGLRATSGNIEAAVDLIHRKRQETEDAMRKNRREQELERIQRKFGKCADGKQWVEMEFVKKLVGMGYSYNLAAAALKQANNIISDAVQIIQDRPDILQAAVDPVVSSEMINQVIGMGFDHRMAKIALKKHRGNIESAIEELVASGGIVEGESLYDSDEENGERDKLRKKEKKAFDRLSEGLATDAEDYLDLTLVQEEQFLNEYMSLLS